MCCLYEMDKLYLHIFMGKWWAKMNYNDLPEWTLPYLDNFTGPYWSDGRLQGSTSRSKKKPVTKLDWHSRDHDREYALCDSLECLDDADMDYYQRTRDMSLGPKVIGVMPLVGNKPLRMIYKALGGSYRGAEAHLRTKMGANGSTDQDWKDSHPLRPGYEYHYGDSGELLGMRPIQTSLRGASEKVPMMPVEGQQTFNDPSSSGQTITGSTPVVVDNTSTLGSTPVVQAPNSCPAGSSYKYDPRDSIDARGHIDITGGGRAYVNPFAAFGPRSGYVNTLRNKRKKRNKIYIAY